MSLRDELKSVTAKKTSSRKVDVILDLLSEEDAKELREILEDPMVEGSDIARLLRKREFNISDRAVQRYRSDNGFA